MPAQDSSVKSTAPTCVTDPTVTIVSSRIETVSYSSANRGKKMDCQTLRVCKQPQRTQAGRRARCVKGANEVDRINLVGKQPSVCPTYLPLRPVSCGQKCQHLLSTTQTDRSTSSNHCICTFTRLYPKLGRTASTARGCTLQRNSCYGEAGGDFINLIRKLKRPTMKLKN